MEKEWGKYLLYLLKGLAVASENIKEKSSEPEKGEKLFSKDETGAVWKKNYNVELLLEFCTEGYAMAVKHGHFAIGKGPGSKSFIAIPGRFTSSEQPAGGKTGFMLWQPLRGGEEYYNTLEELEYEDALNIYGYWIAGLDSNNLTIYEV